MSQEPAGALFAGSSRVAAAIDEDAWGAAAKGPGVNLGRGFSTLQEHYLGLRNLFAKYPQRLRGAYVFIEAPRGMPSVETWQDTWVHPDSPQMIVPVLRISDLPGAWSAPMTFEEKSRVTFGYFLRPSALFTQKDRIGTGFLLLGEDLFARRFGGVRAAPAAEDLASAGGIRTDPESIQRSRITAVRLAREDLQSQRPVVDWDRTVVHDIVQLVEHAGARPVFFEMPLCSVQSATFDSPIRARDRERFAEATRQWGVPVIRAEIALSDDDFPDLWHLRKSRAAEFTRALAEVIEKSRL